MMTNNTLFLDLKIEDIGYCSNILLSVPEIDEIKQNRRVQRKKN